MKIISRKWPDQICIFETVILTAVSPCSVKGVKVKRSSALQAVSLLAEPQGKPVKGLRDDKMSGILTTWESVVIIPG